MSIGGQQIGNSSRWNRNMSMRRFCPHCDLRCPKGIQKAPDVGAMVDMPGGGLTALVKMIQDRPGDTKRVIR